MSKIRLQPSRKSQNFREIFFEVAWNSPENYIKFSLKWMKFWKLPEISLKIGDVFSKFEWTFLKNMLNSF